MSKKKSLAATDRKAPTKADLALIDKIRIARAGVRAAQARTRQMAQPTEARNHGR